MSGIRKLVALVTVAACVVSATSSSHQVARSALSCDKPFLEDASWSFQRDGENWRLTLVVEFDANSSSSALTVAGLGLPDDGKVRFTGGPSQTKFTIAPGVGRVWAYGQNARATISAANSCGITRAPAFTITAPRSGRARLEPNAPKKFTAVALGDSYAAGLGTQVGPTHNRTCERTGLAWPDLLAAEMGWELTNLACSGAKSFNLTSWFKGQVQIDRLKALRPNIVTVMIGGNDVGFSSVLRDCFLRDCSTDGLIERTDGKINLLSNQLSAVFMKIRKAVPKTARIVVVGYPNIFPAVGQPIARCGWLSDQERKGLDDLASKLDYAVMVAAEVANDPEGWAQMQYVSTLNAFRGHQLCSNDSWVFALRLACKFDDRCGHPMLDGQQAIADAVRRGVWLPR